ncbi:MAG: DUF2309 domain-containing protein [Magnetococcales bacterium]|nr:DUF2309 domain-containing protein [Magnetococcales bacterium]
MEHRLIAQAPLKDFVHHNTLHAFQEHPFREALTIASRETGTRMFLSNHRFRELFRQGRITREELLEVILDDATLDARATIAAGDDFCVAKKDVYLCGLIHDLSAVEALQLSWQIEENQALNRFPPDLPRETGTKILQWSGLKGEAEAVADLWSAALEALSLGHEPVHPEQLLDLSADQAEAMISEIARNAPAQEGASFQVRIQIRMESDSLLDDLIHRIGPEWTIRRFLQALTGTDILEAIQPHLVRQMANYMDLGIASWQVGRDSGGFYNYWKECAKRDWAWIFEEISDWDDMMAELPETSLDAIMAEFLAMGLPEEHWPSYMERLCQEIPGWSGMFSWRQQHPGYGNSQLEFDLADYVAVRLILERLFARRLCVQTWKISSNLFFMRWYFQNNKSELLVRFALFNQALPDHLSGRARELLHADPFPTIDEWRAVAHLLWTWKGGQSVEAAGNYCLHHDAWPLFRLGLYLGLCGATLRSFSKVQVDALLSCLAVLTPETSGFLWLQAYECHYRDELFHAVLHNHGHGAWARRERRPRAQVIFCMDDREEGIRRHLEEIDPEIETFGAAGFFGVAINWKGLDDSGESALCPIVDRPSHKVWEMVPERESSLKEEHDHRLGILATFKDHLFNGARHGLLRATAVLALSAPALLFSLTAKHLDPLGFGQWIEKLGSRFFPPLQTAITLTAPEDGTPATPERNRSGFTDAEQAQRVGKLLRIIGLTSGFAPLVVMMGHGSTSKNNPHRAAYDCGACSGRHGGPNARVFAAMANRPEVRALLAREGIDIPEDTRFVGANHNTCDESFFWYDRHLVPPETLSCLERCREDLNAAARLSAQERCRKVASAPDDPDPFLALDHFRSRARDVSQARPELGHATNAAAFVGRRSVSRGLFLDRRVFLISYDPTTDPTGEVLQGILLNVTPVGAGINLEYYFSTVGNDRLGCGSKVTHNLTGFFGIMDGTESDLRTGLPFQMIEIHEAMRLQIMVEAETRILTEIYQRQPLLQELVGNGWVLLSAKDPHGAAIHLFKPDRGWVLWQGNMGREELPVVDHSPAWYRGLRDHLPPARIRTTAEVGHG